MCQKKLTQTPVRRPGQGWSATEKQLFISQHEILYRKRKLGYVAGVLNDPRWDMDFVKKFPKKEMNTFVLIGKWTLH